MVTTDSPTTEALVARLTDMGAWQSLPVDGRLTCSRSATALRENEARIASANKKAGDWFGDMCRWQARAESAERELAELRAQQPVAWIDPADLERLRDPANIREVVTVDLVPLRQSGDLPLYAAIPPRSAEG